LKNITKKALIFSAILSFAILLSACQPPVATTEAASTVQVTPSNTSVPTLTATPAGGLATTSPTQKLRIINQSDIALHNMIVVFPDERIEFGDVPGGTTTEYRDVPQGVYRYAAYDVEVNGQSYEQPVVDWVGETPMQGENFTYTIDLDPARWQTEGRVIQLVQVSTDQPQEVFLPVLSPTLHIGKGSPTSLAVSPDGQWVAVSTQFGVYLYHASTFVESWFAPLPEKAGPVIFDPQSERLGVVSDSAIVILDVGNGGVLARLEGAGGSFAWSPDGRRLVSGSGCEQVTVWDANNGAALKELSGGKCSEGYSGIQVTWGADGRIYGVSMGTKILAWEDDTYELVTDFSAEGAKDTWISAIFAAPVGNLLAQYDSMGLPIVAIVDTKQDRQIHLLDQKVNGPITTLTWAPDGQHLAVAYGMDTGLILIWNAQTGQVEKKIEGYYTASGLGWSPDGKILFGLQTPDGQIHAVAVSNGSVLRSLDGHAPVGTFLTWTLDGLASTNGTVVTWWNPVSGDVVRQETVGSPKQWVNSWPPTGPGTYLFTSRDQTHQVGSVSSKRPLFSDNNQYPFSSAWSWDGSHLADPTHVWDAGTGKLLSQLQDPAQQHTPDQVAWSPDGKRLASADSLNMQPPVIWNAQTGKVLFILQTETGDLKPLWLGLAWSPDGKKLAAVGALMHPDSGADEGMILIWNAETGKQEQLLTAGMNDYRLWTVAWSLDGRFMAVGSTGSDIFLWDMTSSQPLAKLGGHTDISDQLAWSPAGNRLASVARDGTLQIWDLSAFTSGTE
jgi:WD40 repeat protein